MAKSNKLEKKIYEEIHRLDEGILKIFLKKIFKPSVDRVLKKMIKDFDEDPEFQSALSDMLKHKDRVDKLERDYCKKYPNSGLCKAKKIRTY